MTRKVAFMIKEENFQILMDFSLDSIIKCQPIKNVIFLQIYPVCKNSKRGLKGD